MLFSFHLERMIHLVNWDILYSNQKKRGLGTKNLSFINRKWGWRCAMSENSIWNEVINLKYKLEEGGWFTKT